RRGANGPRDAGAPRRSPRRRATEPRRGGRRRLGRVRDPAPLRADDDRRSADGVCLSRLRLPPAGDRPGRPRRSAPRRVVTPVPEPHPAATVVLLRPGADESEVLLIHRPSTMAFGPGLHAFPGGRVDPGDRGAAAAAGGLTAEEAASALGHNGAPGGALARHVAASRAV